MKRPAAGYLDLTGACFTGALVLFFFAILLWRDPLLFWNDDYELSILPVFADVARSWSEGHLPLLSPYSWVCSNLAGEFQYGTFSIFVNAAVVLIWKLPLSFPQQAAALSLAHLFPLALGGYFLARGRSLTRPLAIMVGLVAALNGWMVCWGATDWFGALGAFAWFPWAWWGLERALEEKRGPYRFLWPAPFVYLLITGGFPYTVGMLGLLVVWLSIKSIAQSRNLWSVWPLAIGMWLGVGLAAPAWLALFDYLRGSAREVQESTAHYQWIVPLAALPGFILPAWTVHWADFSTRLVPHPASEMACGLIPPVLLLCALATRTRALVRQLKWELGLLLMVLLISMLPSANVFRWSFRWLPFVALVLTLSAAEAAQILRAEDSLGKKRNAGVFALLLLSAIGLAMWLANTAGPYGWHLLACMLAIAVAWIFLGAKSWALPTLTFLALLATYLVIPPNCGVPKYNLDQKLTAPAPLDPARLYLSVYPAPEYAYRAETQPAPFGTVIRPGSTSMWGGIRLINGYSPIRPAGAARIFGSAIHGELAPWACSYFPEWEGAADGELAQIGVDGIIVARELDVVPKPETEWQLVHASAEGRVYHRRGAAFATLRPAIGSAGTVRVLEDSRNRARAEVEIPAGTAPATIVFSRPYFPGYQARFHGQSLDVHVFRKMSVAVEIPANSHGTVTLEYRPWWLIYGGAVALLSALVVLSAVILRLAKRAEGSRTG
ncbi:MAG: hypothetical protein ACR2HH_10915 [Chthoniobacterales bacterium]